MLSPTRDPFFGDDQIDDLRKMSRGCLMLALFSEASEKNAKQGRKRKRGFFVARGSFRKRGKFSLIAVSEERR